MPMRSARTGPLMRHRTRWHGYQSAVVSLVTAAGDFHPLRGRQKILVQSRPFTVNLPVPGAKNPGHTRLAASGAVILN